MFRLRTTKLAELKGVRQGPSGGSLCTPRSWHIPGRLNPSSVNGTRSEREESEK
jgi:hypothetical protein